MSYFCSRSKHVISTIRRLPVLTAIALVVLAVAVCCLIYEYMTESLSYYFTAFFFILLYSVHSRRKDYRFYLLILDRPKAVMAIEYMLVLLPLTIILLCTGKYISGVLTAVLPFLIVILPRVPSTYGMMRYRITFNINSIESVSFLRKNFFLTVVLLLVAYVFCFDPGLSIAALSLLSYIFIGTSYSENEPLCLILLDEMPAGKFLRSKIFKPSVLWIMLYAPALLLYGIFNIGTFYLVFVPLLILFIGLCVNAFIKYSLYEPSLRHRQTTMAEILANAGIIVPFLLPFTIFMTAFHYRKAKANLNKYLYVYDK